MQTIPLDEQVRLNRQMEYVVCNVVLFPASLFPPSIAKLQPRLRDRDYNLPAYFFAGESQFGVVEVHRGDLLTGCVRFVTKWIDVLDVTVAEKIPRCMVIAVEMGRGVKDR